MMKVEAILVMTSSMSNVERKMAIRFSRLRVSICVRRPKEADCYSITPGPLS